MLRRIKDALWHERSRWFDRLFERYPSHLLKSQTDQKVSQLLLQQQYRSAFRETGKGLDLRAVGFRQYSQFEEDGILLYLFSIIEPRNRRCLELCAGDGIECNTANLIVNHGWWGWMFDGDEHRIAKGRSFYQEHKDTFLHPPSLTHAWITAENVNQVVTDAGLVGPIDLLSLDVDGNDYWIWKALDVVEPTVIVCEVQNIIPAVLAITVPYDPQFTMGTAANDFRGASLAAMVSLGRAKGYRLVGTHRYGFNAFFVKNGYADDALPERDVEEFSSDDYTIRARASRWPTVSEKPWVHV